MPKQTFFNLSKEKQETIIAAAMAEFAEAGYDMSSIQKIIQASGIPRGSFYQYFEDKADLLGEVMVEISKRKLVYLQPVIEEDKKLGLFDLLKDLVKAGIEFAINDPVAFQVGKAMTGSKTLEVKSFIQKFKAQVYERVQLTEEMIYAQSIQNSLDLGEIDSRYSLETVMAYSGRIMEAMAERYWHYMANENDPHAGDAILDEMIHFLRYGLSSSNKTN